MSADHDGVGGFAAVPRWLIREAPLSGNALLVLIALAARENRAGECWPSHATLAAEARMSEKSVRRALDELRDAGHVSWERRHREDGGKSSNHYRVHVRHGAPSEIPGQGSLLPTPSVTGTDPIGHPDRSHRSQGPIPSVTLTDEVTKEEVTTREGKNSPSPRKRGDDDSPEFTRFWDIYPRKVGKGAARTAWARATRKTAPEVITEAAHAHARTWASAATEARFIPHPASWLNAERWNDTLPDVAPTGRTAEDRRRGALDWAAAQYAAERHRPPEIGADQ